MNEPNTIEFKKQQRRKTIRKLIIIFVFSLVLSLILAGFALLWQDSYTLLAFCNAFYVSGFLFFFFGWMILMLNMNILSPMIYGLKSFFLIFAAKKPSLDYYEYLQEKKENPIPRSVVLTPLLASIPNFIVAIILHIML